MKEYEFVVKRNEKDLVSFPYKRNCKNLLHAKKLATRNWKNAHITIKRGRDVMAVKNGKWNTTKLAGLTYDDVIDELYQD